MAKDDYYPLSNFPMYSNPNSDYSYFYVTASHEDSPETLQPLLTKFFFTKPNGHMLKFHIFACKRLRATLRKKSKGIKTRDVTTAVQEKNPTISTTTESPPLTSVFGVEEWKRNPACMNNTLNYLLSIVKPSRRQYLALYGEVQLHLVTISYDKAASRLNRHDAIVAKTTIESFRHSQKLSSLLSNKQKKEALMAELHTEERKWSSVMGQLSMNTSRQQ